MEEEKYVALEEMLSVRNQSEAFEYLGSKKDGSRADGVLLSEIEEYWELNQERIMTELVSGAYQVEIVKCFEIINHMGKRRQISNLCTIDCFIGRLTNVIFYECEKEYELLDRFAETFEEYIDYYNNERIRAKTKWMLL